jgi:transcriptional regulator with XRE-family HTH domain
MVRNPLTPEQLEAGRRLGRLLRDARATRDLSEVALAAGISPETLRKIETGRLPTPGFGTIASLCDVLNLPIQDLATAWRTALRIEAAS